MKGPVENDIQNFKDEFSIAHFEKILNSMWRDFHVSCSSFYLGKN